MTDNDFELLIRIAGNLEGISATIGDNEPLSNYLCDLSEMLDGIIERIKNGT